MQFFASFQMLALLFRTFKYFNMQPRLAIITRTLLLAAPDLVHHLFFTSLVLFGYAVIGNYLWGMHMTAFARYAC
jgi:hypothetical protein